MGNLITIIFIGVFICNLMDSSLKKKKKKKAEKQNAQQWSRQPGAMREDAYYYDRKQQETKERLQKKYGQEYTQAKKPKDDILSRAKENVRENEGDKLQQELHAQVCRAYRENPKARQDIRLYTVQPQHGTDSEESDVLKKVNDLIVMGYSGEPEFERDFVAEGVEMLNRFSI